MLREAPWNVVRGFMMGAADIVPGVSGGTIALVLGIYQRLVASVKAGSSALGRLVRLDGRAALHWLGRVEWAFVAPLVVGIIVAIVALAGLLRTLLTDYPVEMAALFLGLVAGSIVVAWQLLTRRDLRRIVIMVATAAVVFVLLGIRGGTTEATVGQIAAPPLWAFFAAGAVAICAMILPGISGSFILVIVGMYGAVLLSVTERELLNLAVFTLGATVGLALFSQLLHWSLSNHYDSVMAALIGLMAGSMRVLWPWPDGLDSTTLGRPTDSTIPAIVIAVAAAVAVIGISEIAKRVERRSTADEIDELRAV